MSLWNEFQSRYPQSDVSETEFNGLYTHANELILSFITYAYDPQESATAINNATFDQIEAWFEVGQLQEHGGYAPNTSISLGDLTIGGQPSFISPRAKRTLRQAGLLRIIGE